MKFRVGAIILAASVLPLLASPASAATVMLPAGTAVPVHVLGSVSSADAKEGDTFVIQVASDVVVNGYVVIPKGAGGRGSVVGSESAGGNGHSGSLALVLDYVNSADGGRVKLSDTPVKQSEDERAGAKSTANIIGVATLGIGGLFAHNLVKGKQKTIDEKTILTGFVERNVHVHAVTRTEDAQYDR